MLSFFVWRLSSLDARGIAKVSAANVLLLLRIMKNWRELRKYSDRADFYKLLPAPAIVFVHQLLRGSECDLFITEPRKARLGCFARRRYKSPYIELNNDLTPYFMLIVFLHEWAHFMTWKEFGNRVSPHGKEWKLCYSKLILPIIDSKKLPHDIEVVLTNSLINVKASSCSDQNLQRVLTKYNPKNTNFVTLESLEKNSIFELNGRLFEKGVLRRTRFMCKEQHGKRYFLVNRLAMVKEFKNEQE